MSDDQTNDDKPSTFAEQLANLDVEVSDEPANAEPPPSKVDSLPSQPSTTPESAQPEKSSDESLSDEELFEQAINDIDPGRVYSAKYRGEAAADLPDAPSTASEQSPSEKPVSDEERRQSVEEVRDAAIFQQMVGPVTPLEDRDKYHRSRRSPQTSQPDQSGDDSSLLTPSLPRSGDGLHYVPPLTASQRSLMDRHRRFASSNAVPDIHLRGDTRDEALARLREFVLLHWKRQNTRFVRLIHGRGLQSESEPILKPTVLRWLEDSGREYIRGYAPERGTSGDYGSLIVELSPRHS